MDQYELRIISYHDKIRTKVPIGISRIRVRMDLLLDSYYFCKLPIFSY